MKLCKDCKHFDQNGHSAVWAKCHHPFTNSIDPVTGASQGRYCDFERKWNWLQTRVGTPAVCGREARWFEPKD